MAGVAYLDSSGLRAVNRASVRLAGAGKPALVPARLSLRPLAKRLAHRLELGHLAYHCFRVVEGLARYVASVPRLRARERESRRGRSLAASRGLYSGALGSEQASCCARDEGRTIIPPTLSLYPAASVGGGIRCALGSADGVCVNAMFFSGSCRPIFTARAGELWRFLAKQEADPWILGGPRQASSALRAHAHARTGRSAHTHADLRPPSSSP